MAKYDCHRFSGLELLPTSMLEKIIEQDFKQEADYDPELIDCVLDLLVKRGKKEDPQSIPEVQPSWNKLQQQLGNEVNLGSLPATSVPARRTKTAPRRKSFLRYVAVVAACIALTFGAMITVQAMGVDVFGVLAKWTDSTFQFEIPRKENPDETFSSHPGEGALKKALSDMGLPTDLAPTWIPEDYTLVNTDLYATEQYNRVHFAYIRPNSSKYLTINISESFDSLFLASGVYEKSSDKPEIYDKDGMQFYIFENNGTWTATWSNIQFSVSIFGAESKETVIAIIDSI